METREHDGEREHTVCERERDEEEREGRHAESGVESCEGGGEEDVGCEDFENLVVWRCSDPIM